VAFHVEIRRSLRHARAFNLTEQRLRAILDPWRAGRTVELGDQEWDPAESELRILEGPELSPPDLALGQGWNNAERSGTDVTARALAQATVVAVLADTAEAYEAATRFLGGMDVREADWDAVRARLLSGGNDVPGVVVLIVAAEATPSPGWLFDAGIAIGALGGRAIVTRLGDDPLPKELRDFGATPLDQPAALAERVRAVARTG
jgi:hypothetical protein